MRAAAKSPVLVLGATGGQGGAVAGALLARGTRVRALVRRADAPSVRRLGDQGVEAVVGSLDDRIALGAAMRGVAGVFAVTTPFESGVDAEVAQGRAILAAAIDEQVAHLVFSSVAGADQHSCVPHFESKAITESELAGSGVPLQLRRRQAGPDVRCAISTRHGRRSTRRRQAHVGLALDVVDEASGDAMLTISGSRGGGRNDDAMAEAIGGRIVCSRTLTAS